MQILMSIIGCMTIFAIAFLLSNNRGRINPRTVFVAFGLQTAIAALVLYVPRGGDALNFVVRGVQHVIGYANDGISF